MTDVSTTKRGSMSASKKLKVYELRKGICCICELPIDKTKGFIVEHIIPLGLGGDDTIENMGAAHPDCASIKTKRDVWQIAKAKRQKQRSLGIKRTKGRPMPGSKASGLKKKFNGEVVKR
jgi:5-methylcytosine-specific restriction endonuclease McrA